MTASVIEDGSMPTRERFVMNRAGSVPESNSTRRPRKLTTAEKPQSARISGCAEVLS